MMKKIHMAGILAVLLFFGTGCSFTSSLWEQAGNDHLTLIRLYGVRSSGDAHQNVLVAGYSARRDRVDEKFFEIPLDEQGMPPAVMIYRGKERSFSAIGAALSAHRDRRLQTLQFAPWKRPQKVVSADSQSNQLVPLVSQGWPYLPEAEECCVGGFRRSADGMLEPVKPQEIKKPNEWNLVWPDDCTILLFPLTQPRSAGD